MATIFSKIISGEIPCHKVHESANYLAFLDIMPLKKGHVLVIPKKETDNIFDMENDDLSGLMCFSKEVAKKMKAVLPCKKIGVTIIGLEVAHAHIHLIPIDSVSDMDFSKEKLKLSSEELKDMANLIAAQ